MDRVCLFRRVVSLELGAEKCSLIEVRKCGERGTETVFGTRNYEMWRSYIIRVLGGGWYSSVLVKLVELSEFSPDAMHWMYFSYLE